jgi:hypothetical protein
MKKSLIIIPLTFFFILANQIISKQSYPQEDRQLWLCTQIEYNLNKDIELLVSEEIRFYKNRCVLSQSLTDFGIAYKFTNYFKAGIYYRYRILPDENERRHEIFTNLTFKPKLERFEITDRIRVHIKFRDDKESINNIRNKLTLGYKITEWAKPYIDAELFYRFFYEEGDRLTQGRYSLGIKSKLFKNHELDLFFMLEFEYNTTKAINSNIIGFTYTLNL